MDDIGDKGDEVYFPNARNIVEDGKQKRYYEFNSYALNTKGGWFWEKELEALIPPKSKIEASIKLKSTGSSCFLGILKTNVNLSTYQVFKKEICPRPNHEEEFLYIEGINSYEIQNFVFSVEVVDSYKQDEAITFSDVRISLGNKSKYIQPIASEKFCVKIKKDDKKNDKNLYYIYSKELGEFKPEETCL